MTKEEAKRAAEAKRQAKLKAESRERAQKRAARKAREQAERTQRIEAGRRRSAERSQRRKVEKKRTANRPTLPRVVYTAPKPFNSAGFLLRLATVVAVVFALTFCISIFFRVEVVNVSGTELYTPWDVMQASGIKEGDNLLGLAKAKASGRITATLPYIKSVRIGIQLPNTVNIEVTESEVVYAAEDAQGNWWILTATGRIVEQTTTNQTDYAKILGVRINNPAPGEQVLAQEDPANENAIPAADRLTAALTIAAHLENCGIISGVKTIDVVDTGNLELWYGTQYQVKLGDVSRLDYKIACLKAAVEQMEDYRSGVLDISFTVWPDQPAYTPFSDD
jgi:cell division protein FtsQ